VESVRTMSAYMARISIRSTWAALLDFETRCPSAIDAAIAGSYHVGKISVFIIVRPMRRRVQVTLLFILFSERRVQDAA